MFCPPELVFDYTDSVGSRFHVLRSRTHFRRYRGRQVPFSCFAHPDSFPAVPRALAPIFIFCALGHVFAGVLRARSRFQRYRRRWVRLSCFALTDSFSAVPWASGPVFMFCAPKHVFGGTMGVGSRFHILCAWTRFRRCLVRRVPISCLGRPFSFSAVPRALGAVFMFCSPDSFSAVPKVSGPVFMFCSRTRFRRYRCCRVQFSFFACPHSFSLEPRASGPVFNFLRARTRFLQYRGRRVLFSCFALPDSLSVVPRASAPVYMFCAPGLVFGGTEGVGSRFHVLLFRTHFRRYRGRQAPFSCFALPDLFSAIPRASGSFFMFCAPVVVFASTEGVRSRFHVLRAWT
jgi:hypothetical protein